MKKLTILLLTLLGSSSAFAAPRCLELTAKQAYRAVHVMKVAVGRGSPLEVLSRKESGLLRPMGIWAEKKKSGRGSGAVSSTGKGYRVRLDGREVDISLIYVAASPQEGRAWNVGWLSGCRQAPDKPDSIINIYQQAAPPAPKVAPKPAPAAPSAPAVSASK